jgi:ribose 5-phosphate isomerase B
MIIYLGSDHRGFELKEYIEKLVRAMGYEAADVGSKDYRADDDYPDIAEEVARKVSQGYENSRGILVCGSGVGVDIVANKFRHVRSALVFNADQAYDSRNDNDSNVLCLGADYLSKDEAKRILVTWLETPFSGEERHERRLQKIYKIEERVSREVS